MVHHVQRREIDPREQELGIIRQILEQQDHNNGEPSVFTDLKVKDNRTWVNPFLGWFKRNVNFYCVSDRLFCEADFRIARDKRVAFEVVALGDWKVEWIQNGRDALVYYPDTKVLIKRAPGWSDLGFGVNVHGLYYYGEYVCNNAVLRHTPGGIFSDERWDVAIPQGVITEMCFMNNIPHITYRRD